MKKTLSLLLCCLLCLFMLQGALAGQAAGITGTLFLDANGNGQMDGGDNPLSAAEIALVSADGAQQAVIATTLSSGQGAFAFPSLSPGSYIVRAMLPRGHVPTAPAEGGSFALPGNSQSASTPVFSLAEGETKSLLIGSTKKTGFIKAIAFGDENANSGRFSTEPLLSGVLVEAVYEADGVPYVVASATTNKEGEATLRGLTPASYRVAATLPDPYIVGPVGNKVSLFYNAIVPSDDSRGLSEPITVPAGGSVGIGIGGVLTGKATGRVWMDANGNGAMDAAESGFEGAEIRLSNPAKGVDRSLTTGQDGSYSFDKLQDGNYQLSAMLPDTAMFTVPGQSLLSDASAQTDSAEITVHVGKETALAPIGVAPLTALELLAFHDHNFNGLPDEGEPAFAGASVSLKTADGKALNAQTDANGLAVFSPLRAGDIQISASLPDRQVFTVHHPDGSVFTADTAQNSASTVYTLKQGDRARLFAGVTLPSGISGMVFDDANLSGIRETGDNSIEGIAVEALNADGQAVKQAKTDANGAFLLDGLLPGTYTVRFHIVSPYIFSNASSTGAETESKVIDQTPTYGDTAPVAVRPGETATHLDAGIFRSAVINGRVLLGDAKDGFSGALGGLPGVKVSLLDEDGAPVSDYTVAETDASGAFSLKGALPGTYKLQYSLPEGAAFSRPMQEEAVYVTDALTVRSSDVLDCDALFAVRTASISGAIYSDVNANGKQDSDEAPIAGAVMRLFSSDGIAVEAVADDSGVYRLSGLRPADYTAEITLPEGNLIMKAEGLPIEAAQQSKASAPLTLSMGEQKEGMDVVSSPAVRLSASAFYDNDLSRTLTDVDIPFPQATLTLTHEWTGAVFTAALDENGAAEMENLYTGRYTFAIELKDDHAVYSPEAAMSGGVWTGSMVLDGTDNMLALALVQFGSVSGNVWNMDGSADNVNNLPVTLKNEDTGEQLSAVTNAGGAYTFSRLLPGRYTLSTRLSAGFRFARSVDTQVRASVITSDGQAAAEKGQSAPITLSMGQHLSEQDIGIGATGKLGDFAWLDLDGDGMQDADEPGIPGLTIRLYRYGEVAAEAVTDAYGRYMIGDLYPGEYVVEVVLPAELETTKVQTEFPLVANVLPAGQQGTARAEGIIVPSKSRNLNCDLGFTLVTPGRYPANLQNLPSKDWTPIVPYTPTR